jgi:2-polyprenyl-6-methoxyphenol hydroxylase-like FAD-dependent oxidoreductase
MTTRAAVMGGSVAGLLSARVLSERFPEVVIVERDLLPSAPLARRGTPQAHHQHTLLPRGRLILERLFPGLEEELVGQGAVRFDLAGDVAWLTRSGWACRFRSGLMALSCSRELLEWAVRRRVCALARVEVLSGHAVSGFTLPASGTAVNGLRLRAGGGCETVLPADLVVDASGRGSRTPAWLEALGFPRPTETVIDAAVGYASRTFRRPAHTRQDWTVAYLQSAPPAVTRGGMLFPIEGDRWRVSLVGYCGDHPPTDEAGFLAFSRTLRSPLIYEAIRDAEPLSTVVGGRSSSNRLRHYDVLRPRPEGLIVIGDAACAFNPVFAQGMTMAAIGAEVLARCLAESAVPSGRRMLTERFYPRLARALAGPWRMNRLHDGPLAGLDGAVGFSERLVGRYLAELGRLGCARTSARRAALEVASLLRSPLRTVRPDLPAAILAARGAVRRRAPADGRAHVTSPGVRGKLGAADTTEARSRNGAFPLAGRH